MVRFYGFLQKKTVGGGWGVFTGGLEISTVFLDGKNVVKSWWNA
jgi:hypothetical protein